MWVEAILQQEAIGDLLEICGATVRTRKATVRKEKKEVLPRELKSVLESMNTVLPLRSCRRVLILTPVPRLALCKSTPPFVTIDDTDPRVGILACLMLCPY